MRDRSEAICSLDGRPAPGTYPLSGFATGATGLTAGVAMAGAVDAAPAAGMTFFIVLSHIWPSVSASNCWGLYVSPVNPVWKFATPLATVFAMPAAGMPTTFGA